VWTAGRFAPRVAADGQVLLWVSGVAAAAAAAVVAAAVAAGTAAGSAAAAGIHIAVAFDIAIAGTSSDAVVVAAVAAAAVAVVHAPCSSNRERLPAIGSYWQHCVLFYLLLTTACCPVYIVADIYLYICMYVFVYIRFRIRIPASSHFTYVCQVYATAKYATLCLPLCFPVSGFWFRAFVSFLSSNQLQVFWSCPTARKTFVNRVSRARK